MYKSGYFHTAHMPSFITFHIGMKKFHLCLFSGYVHSLFYNDAFQCVNKVFHTQGLRKTVYTVYFCIGYFHIANLNNFKHCSVDKWPGLVTSKSTRKLNLLTERNWISSATFWYSTWSCSVEFNLIEMIQ